ncbi:TfoX/Sxy family protein [Candidatus Chloroploca sp. Khr17]|uniref:TfoX/Sxy family protein n=1 Tax=Candidatus Chloroploca sp. Khr17 TaxID=2496869 RepID=UPI00101B8A77|nr:TfoX/Sxy family protein [Candidatus Chloroploca sp. Khr17]
MAFDDDLARRVREMLAEQPALRERKMFGGLAFLLAGNMCCAILGDELLVRVGPERYPAALAQPYARIRSLAGRTMTGVVVVAPAGLASDEALQSWVMQGVAYAMSLPPKA